MFGCGLEPRLFQEKYRALSESEQDKLERVARRIGITIKLRYETSVYQNPIQGPNEQFELQHVELPALEIYLLVSCLDSLAGQATYVDFGSWLLTQSLPKSLQLQEVTTLFEQYQTDYGVGRNIQNMLFNLPPLVKDWLTSNIAIREVDEVLSTAKQDTSILLRNLYKYFYNIRRNQFTHQSAPKQVSRAGPVVFNDAEQWWVTPAAGTAFILDSRRPNKEWNFSYRKGLDETIILRVIIHAAALRILDIEFTQQLFAANLRNHERLDALYGFVGEVSYNANLLASYGRTGQQKNFELRTYFIYAGLPLLLTEATIHMLGLYNAEQGWESGMREMTGQYLTEVQQFNLETASFNAAHPHKKSGESTTDHWDIIEKIVHLLIEGPNYSSILNWPSKVQMKNLWLIIRDPCYT
jgi:hypothetical protein